jgi:predicted amidohydrolase
MTELKVACVQLCSGCDPTDNMAEIDRRVRLAAAAGARLIALPEACTFIEKTRAAMRARLFTEHASPEVAAFADLARTLGVWVLAGSQFLADADGAAVNRSLVFAPDGNIAARYDKIHMFDVTLPNGEVHAESQSYKPGTTASLVDVDGVRLGLSICYDMRFPAMYRALARAGAQVLSVPSAFTQVTGEAHWHVLLRARAIENGAYVLAPAQHGKHENGRQTFGHSLIVDPWGTVVAEAGNGDDFVMAELDMRAVDKARTALPVFDHGRGFSLSDTGEAVHD